MKTKTSLTQADLSGLFKDTIVGPDDLHSYLLNSDLSYVRTAQQLHPGDKRTIAIAGETERFEGLLRSHLAGSIGAHGQIFHQIRDMFETHGEVAEWVVFFVTHNMRNAIQRNSWYPIQAKFDSVTSQIRNHVEIWKLIIQDVNYVKPSH